MKFPVVSELSDTFTGQAEHVHAFLRGIDFSKKGVRLLARMGTESPVHKTTSSCCTVRPVLKMLIRKINEGHAVAVLAPEQAKTNREALGLWMPDLRAMTCVEIMAPCSLSKKERPDILTDLPATDAFGDDAIYLNANDKTTAKRFAYMYSVLSKRRIAFFLPCHHTDIPFLASTPDVRGDDGVFKSFLEKLLAGHTLKGGKLAPRLINEAEIPDDLSASESGGTLLILNGINWMHISF